MDTFFELQPKPVLSEVAPSEIYGGVPAKKVMKKRVALKTKKLKIKMHKKSTTAKINTLNVEDNAMILERTQSERGKSMDSTTNGMVLQRSISGPNLPVYMQTPADLLSGTPQASYDKTKPSEITIYMSGHGEEYFPRKGRENPFPKILLELIESKKMRVRMVNKVNAPLVEGLAMASNNPNVIFKTEDEFYKDAIRLFKEHPKVDTKKIMKQLGKDYIGKYQDYLRNIAEKIPGKEKEHYTRIQLKKEILKKSNYLDLYHPNHEKYFTIRPITILDETQKDDTAIMRYGIYIVDIRNSPHENILHTKMNLCPMYQEYNENKSMYLDLISYLRLLLCSYGSPNELENYRMNVCNAIEKMIIPDNKLTTVTLSDILILFYYLGFTNINIIDSTCRVDCGSNTGVCSYYQIGNLLECNYDIKKSLIEIAKLKKDLVISPYSESSPESGNKQTWQRVAAKKKTKKGIALTANIEKKFTRKLKQ